MNTKFFIKKNHNYNTWEVCYRHRGARTHEVLAACSTLEDAKFFYNELRAIAHEVGYRGMKQWIMENEGGF